MEKGGNNSCKLSQKEKILFLENGIETLIWKYIMKCTPTQSEKKYN